MQDLYRVLIVDDEPLIRQGIKHYLDWEKAGFEIVGEASNGQEALALIPRCQPHIMLTDMVMPIMDGEVLTKEMKQHYPDIQVVILSSFGEYDYVRSAFHHGAIDYILKPKLNAKDLHDVLRKAAKHIPKGLKHEETYEKAVSSKSTQIEKVIDGYSSKEDIDQLCEVFTYPYFCLIGVVSRNESDDINKVECAERLLAPFYKEHEDQVRYTWIKEDQHTAMAIINLNNLELYERLKNVCQVEAQISFIMTSCFEQLEQLRRIYLEEWKELTQLPFYFSEQSLICSEDASCTEKEESFNLDWFTDELKNGHYDLAFQYLRQYSYSLVQSARLSVNEFRSFFNHIFFTVTILLSNHGYERSKLEQVKFSYVSKVSAALSAHEVIEYMERFIEEMNDTVNQVNVKGNEDSIQQVIEYISTHYHEPISLNVVAEMFHFNASYLSTQFSHHMKVGFNEYVNRIRIEYACKQLTEGKRPIAEIGEVVGYSDHSYFCKVFKKLKGVSPSYYRRQQKKGQLRELG
ncbi:response regulator transcription factor [Alkalihalobacillus hemicellulosilyticus]|uniref:DNA-binding response regulator n=1 Tax=Halalkalibacter hemicellulosilyticusJCM 9152 TaxID=1236971 RepID=W4QD46_9BACI|nr:response regulator [Halalkalibacter hemicellulosilyticus]GAE29971.1 DNA-binding response regulator [Halalkalibacter hemicellulosilyticusJCM 9152]